jgi:hypothetical protein
MEEYGDSDIGMIMEEPPIRREAKVVYVSSDDEDSKASEHRYGVDGIQINGDLRDRNYQVLGKYGYSKPAVTGRWKQINGNDPGAEAITAAKDFSRGQ